MKGSFRVSRHAAADLDEIWLFIAQDNLQAADKMIREITLRISKLASMPHIGRSRDELSQGLRSFPIGQYIIFYRPKEDWIEIARVLHGARNFPPLFE